MHRPRIEALQKQIIRLIGDKLHLERQQVVRLKAGGHSTTPLEQLYTSQGTLLEQAIQNILVEPFCPLQVTRITKQRRNEADLRLLLSTGRNGIAQVTAKEKPTDAVSLTKAGSILQQSPDLNPQAFLCFGRPDFHEDAVSAARSHARNGTNYKLIPIFVLAEMYVRFHERKLSAQRVAAILETETGYIGFDRL